MNPKDKIGQRKVALTLVPPASIIYEALAMRDGAKKYGPFNWRTEAVSADVYVNAALRHLLSWYDGEENSSDSAVSHLGHAKACIGIMIDAMENGKLIDDRPAKGSASELLERFKDSVVPLPSGGGEYL